MTKTNTNTKTETKTNTKTTTKVLYTFNFVAKPEFRTIVHCLVIIPSRILGEELPGITLEQISSLRVQQLTLAALGQV